MKKLIALFLLIISCTQTPVTYTPPVTTQVIVSIYQNAIVCDYVWVYSERGVEDILMRGSIDTLNIEGSWVALRWVTRCGDPSTLKDTLCSVNVGKVELR